MTHEKGEVSRLDILGFFCVWGAFGVLVWFCFFKASHNLTSVGFLTGIYYCYCVLVTFNLYKAMQKEKEEDADVKKEDN